MVTKYEYGRSIEYKAKNELQENNYVVFRQSGSHTCFDLICVHPQINCIRFLQLKSVSGKYYSFKSETQQIHEFEFPKQLREYISKELWIWLRPIKGIRKAHWIKKVIE